MAIPDERPGPGITAADLTHGRVLRIAVPIVLANITVPLLGAVDTGVVGQLGAAAPIGAVGLGAVILSVVFWMFNFLRMGTTGLVAQARGAGDSAEETAVLVRALAIAVALGLGMIAFQVPFVAGAFWLAPASAEVEELARGYLGIRIWGAPATIALMALTGWMIATERTRSVLLLQLWINGLNIGLDLWFVLGLGWGVEGVALATVIAEVTGLVLALWLCRAAFALRGWRDPARIFDGVQLRRMLSVNADIFQRSVLLNGAFAAFVFLGAGLGDVTLAANQVLLQFMSLLAQMIDGFAMAAETLVGQAVGAKSVARLRRSVRVSGIQAGLAGLVLMAGFWALGPWLIDLMATAPEVRAAARVFLPWVLAATLVSLVAYMLDGIFIGATQTRAMRDAMALAALAFALVAVVGLSVLGNHGLWLALIAQNSVRVLVLGWRYPQVEAAAMRPAPVAG